MTITEANKIIAEYLGWKVLTPKEWSERLLIEKNEICSNSPKINFSKSIDMMIPIWQKLKISQVKFEGNNSFNQCEIAVGINPTVWCNGDTLFEAACLATAKLIKDLDVT